MKRKKIAIHIIIIIAIGIFTTTILQAMYYSPSDEIPIPIEMAEEIEEQRLANSTVEYPLYPARLVIPSIDIDAKIEEVGISRKGNMATPKNFSNTGWYKYGTIPGQKGSAVIAGHVDNGFSLAGVFSELSDLKKGDAVFVVTRGDEWLHFIVTDSKIYDFDEKPEEVFREDGEHILRLITCTGTWMEEKRTHNKRLVVRAVLIES
jgi:LPXTG-site transpeptidase (sortase) family protein